MQQDTVFRDWWVAAETRRKLGFIGRIAVGFTQERLVRRGNRRDASSLLRSALCPLWARAARDWGQHLEHAPAPCMFTQEGSRAFSQLDEQLGLLRADREDFGYGVRTVLGKPYIGSPAMPS